jgi:single-stranded DNA-binding protein
MSFDVLIAGKLVKSPESRTSKSDKTYAIAQVLVPVEGDDSVFASCIAFNAAAVETLLALDRGDAVALAGRAKLNAWTGTDRETKTGLSVTVDAVLTAYHVQRACAAASRSHDRGADVATQHRDADRAPQAALDSRSGHRVGLAVMEVAADGSIADLESDPLP